jgi:hypothetical protein
VCQRSNGYFAPTVVCKTHSKRYSARQSQSSVRRRTGQCTVTVRWSRRQKLQRSNPNGRVTWLAHRTVRWRHATDSLSTATFGGWGYKYPNHPTIHCIQVFRLPTPYKSYSIQYKTHQRDQILSQVQRSFQNKLVTRESDLCSFELLRLDCFFSFSFFLVINSIVTEARDTNCVVILAGTLCPI